MPVRNRYISLDAGPGKRGWYSEALVSVWLATATSVKAAAEDDYLKMLEVEAKKVEAPASAPASPDADGLGAQTDIGVFENELKRHYPGTHAFYRKLPRRTQEEIYEEYSQGASIEDIRDKIYDRYLNKK